MLGEVRHVGSMVESLGSAIDNSGGSIAPSYVTYISTTAPSKSETNMCVS